MRILHTSDWHLGLSSGRVSRLPEQRLFLDWLLGQLSAQRIDALVVAGDVFDTMQPSTEAQQVYFNFLRGVSDTGVRQVVIVGGNHDSASVLEAPRAVLDVLDVYVVGGVEPGVLRGEVSDMVVPLRARGDDAEAVAGVCLAIPYVHEYRLGIRTTDDADTVRADFRARFAKLYSDAMDMAAERHPGVPVVAAGHLTVGTREAGDSPREIHMVGTLDSLPVDVFDGRIDYVALGHIHRCYPVERGRVWYSGTPVPVGVVEARAPRQLLRVDVVSGAPAEVHKLEVPVFRKLLHFKGPADEVLQEVRGLVGEPAGALAPLLYLDLGVEGPRPGLGQQVQDALAHIPAEQRPLQVELREYPLTGAGADAGAAGPVPQLAALDPLQVFERLCAVRSVDDPLDLRAALSELRSANGELWKERVKTVEAGQDAVANPPRAGKGQAEAEPKRTVHPGMGS